MICTYIVAGQDNLMHEPSPQESPKDASHGQSAANKGSGNWHTSRWNLKPISAAQAKATAGNHREEGTSLLTLLAALVFVTIAAVSCMAEIANKSRESATNAAPAQMPQVKAAEPAGTSAKRNFERAE